jgi:hypothetical protein
MQIYSSTKKQATTQAFKQHSKLSKLYSNDENFCEMQYSIRVIFLVLYVLLRLTIPYAYISFVVSHSHGRSYNADHTASRSAQRSQAASSQASITVGDHVRSLDNARNFLSHLHLSFF